MCGGLMGSARMGRARLVFRDRVGRGVADVPQTLAEVDIVPRDPLGSALHLPHQSAESGVASQMLITFRTSCTA